MNITLRTINFHKTVTILSYNHYDAKQKGQFAVEWDEKKMQFYQYLNLFHF